MQNDIFRLPGLLIGFSVRMFLRKRIVKLNFSQLFVYGLTRTRIPQGKSAVFYDSVSIFEGLD